MDALTAHTLNKLNQVFYARNAASFSSTRSAPWPGWERLRFAIEEATTVLDVACGNMRFEKYAETVGGAYPKEYHCVDSCLDLAIDLPNAHFQDLDIVDLCIRGAGISQMLQSPACDLVVSFGFLHHVPGFEARRRLIDALVEKTAQGGRLALSFWRFMEDDRLAQKALAVTERAKRAFELVLEENDYILGWQGDNSAYRYCHNYTDDEISELLSTITGICEPELRYNSDGRNDMLNTYIVLRKGIEQ